MLLNEVEGQGPKLELQVLSQNFLQTLGHATLPSSMPVDITSTASFHIVAYRPCTWPAQPEEFADTHAHTQEQREREINKRMHSAAWLLDFACLLQALEDINRPAEPQAT